ncbi:MAG TPA: CHC2 zinc finger domain-containing protein, partial [Candidatus Kapabacteria bacterium]
MKVSSDQLDRIREATNIVDLVTEHVRLKKRGRNFIGLCPFHSEKTP